jgi:hypothetical protein
MGVGVALFMAGNAWFRRVLGMTGNGLRNAGALISLVTVVLGLWSALAQLTALIALIVTVIVQERHSVSRPSSR